MLDDESKGIWFRRHADHATATLRDCPRKVCAHHRIVLDDQYEDWSLMQCESLDVSVGRGAG
jgi:hypothetical protein